jgi:uncharacterized protein YndB with AHSA1/START domain
MSATAGDSAAASVFVAVPVAAAFEVFTLEIDAWWRHGRKYRIAGKRSGRLSFEPGLGGRLIESVDLASGTKVFTVGSIVEWRPPHKLAFEWRAVNFAPHESTLVEVTFTPSGEGTLVRVEHHGWSRLRDDHPARHGQASAEFARGLGLWWGGLLTGLREYVAVRGALEQEQLER